MACLGNESMGGITSKKKWEELLQKKINSLLHLLYFALAGNEFVGPITMILCLGNTAPVEENSQWWRAVGNTVFNMTGPEFKP